MSEACVNTTALASPVVPDVKNIAAASLPRPLASSSINMP